MKTPIISLVGRTNVGKSAIFNRIANQKVKSLVFDKEHVTRDYIESSIVYKEKKFLLVDTGGIFMQKAESPLEELARTKALEVIERSEIVLFVCDAKVGVLQQDIDLLRMLRKKNSKIKLLVNKVDNNYLKMEASDFLSLGFSDYLCTSAAHGIGTKEVMDFIVETLPQKERTHLLEDGTVAGSEELVDDESIFKVAIIGKPNVGKSSLLNLLGGKDRSIVSDIEGTTREAVGSKVSFNHQLIELVDTPGVRRQASVNESLESKMVQIALASIRTSDIVMLMIDASKGDICNQELKLLSYALECKKAVLFIMNKIDLMDERAKVNLEYEMERYDFMLKKVPIIKTSCLNRKGLSKICASLDALWKRCKKDFDANEVTMVLKEYLNHRPLYKNGQVLKVFRTKFVKAKVPTFNLYVNEPTQFSSTELNCLENVLRKKFDLRGCPVVLKTMIGFS